MLISVLTETIGFVTAKQMFLNFVSRFQQFMQEAK